MHKLPDTVRAAINEARSLETDPLAAFVYDLDALEQHVSEVMAALPAGVELYYAIKANSEAPVLATLAPLVSGFEISSGGEIERGDGVSDAQTLCVLRPRQAGLGPAQRAAEQG